MRVLASFLFFSLVSCGKPAHDANADTDLQETADDTAPDIFHAVKDVGVFAVGASVRSIVPACMELWNDIDADHLYNPTNAAGGDTFLDCGCDHLCADDPGYPGPDDGEGDGVFQGVWIGGFSNGRPALGVRGADLGLLGEGDGLDARAIVIERDGLRVAIVAFDSLGLMYDDTLRIRQAVRDRGLAVDHVIIHSSHSHSSPDAMGMWGPTIAETGYDERYFAQVRASAVDAIEEAIAGLEPVTMRWAETDLTDKFPNGAAHLISDTRDPVVIDPRVGIVQFVRADGSTLASIVHWANHPETIGGGNNLLTSDFPHAIRKVVSEGYQWPEGPTIEGIGGTTIYWQGAIGGMMTSLHAEPADPMGHVYADATWEKVDTVGILVATQALDALKHAAHEVREADLAVGAQSLSLRVQNKAFLVAFRLGDFAHRAEGAHHLEGGVETATLDSEMDVLQFGPLRMITWPGEVLPEVMVGGKDGAFTPPGVPITSPDNPNPPDMSAMPDGPYPLERLGGQLTWLLGLGNDEVGYLIPPFEFETHPTIPYFDEAPGDHYEETNSLGPDAVPTLISAQDAIVAWLDAVAPASAP